MSAVGTPATVALLLVAAVLCTQTTTAFSQDGEGGAGVASSPALVSPFAHAETTLVIFVAAGLYYTCLGWARKVYKRAQGEKVPIDWTKVRNAAITGSALGFVAWMAVWLGILPVNGDFYDEHFNFALMFGFATATILPVHRFMLTAPDGEPSRAVPTA